MIALFDPTGACSLIARELFGILAAIYPYYGVRGVGITPALDYREIVEAVRSTGDR